MTNTKARANANKIYTILATFGIFFNSLINNHSYAQDSDKKDVIYKYKDYEVIDLGNMEIKGQIMTPGDLTVSERERAVFKRSLLEKANFDYENRREVENLR